MIRRGLTVAAVAALSWTLTTASAEASTTTIGAVDQISSGTAPDPTTTNGYAFQAASTSGRSYAVPAGYGVITKLLHRTGTQTGILTFKVYRPAGPGFLTVAAEPHIVTAGVTNSFDVRIPVQQGDVLGLSSDTGIEEAYDGGVGDVVGFFTSDPAVGTTATAAPGPTGYYLDVAAVLESDADRDGYGDDTQDGCPTDARTFGKCARTTITKAPKSKVLTSSSKAKVKIKFTGADPAGTFRCAVDGGAFKVCRSPFKKKFHLGKHTVKIEAVNALGVVELQPQVVKFRVKRRH
jgi:hypothetical protein